MCRGHRGPQGPRAAATAACAQGGPWDPWSPGPSSPPRNVAHSQPLRRVRKRRGSERVQGRKREERGKGGQGQQGTDAPLPATRSRRPERPRRTHRRGCWLWSAVRGATSGPPAGCGSTSASPGPARRPSESTGRSEGHAGTRHTRTAHRGVSSPARVPPIISQQALRSRLDRTQLKVLRAPAGVQGGCTDAAVTRNGRERLSAGQAEGHSLETNGPPVGTS